MNTTLHLSEADEIEAIAPPALTGEQEILVDLHSVINLLSVLAACLELLDDPMDGALAASRERVAQATAAILTLAAAEQDVGLDLALADALTAELDAALEARPDLAGVREVDEIASTIRSVLAVFRLRGAELQARSGKFHEWRPFQTVDLADSLRRVLAVIEQNARGRYRIVSNIAQQTPADYQIDLKVTSDGGDTFRMPAVLQDVLRDLVANARKYTAAGGRISAGLHASSDGIRIVVEDNGIGIPREELTRVFEYGYRASNALDRRTMGGGFGLTKALWVTRKFQGRLWLRSKVDVGTRVTLLIPGDPAASHTSPD